MVLVLGLHMVSLIPYLIVVTMRYANEGREDVEAALERARTRIAELEKDLAELSQSEDDAARAAALLGVSRRSAADGLRALADRGIMEAVAVPRSGPGRRGCGAVLSRFLLSQE